MNQCSRKTDTYQMSFKVWKFAGATSTIVLLEVWSSIKIYFHRHLAYRLFICITFKIVSFNTFPTRLKNCKTCFKLTRHFVKCETLWELLSTRFKQWLAQWAYIAFGSNSTVLFCTPVLHLLMVDASSYSWPTNFSRPTVISRILAATFSALNL